MSIFSTIIAAAVSSFGAAPAAGEAGIPARPVSTFSIVAYDPKAGEMGVGVQSHWFSVGSVVPWAEPGAGVVATQSLARIEYGPDGLKLMKEGANATDALRQLIANDGAQDVRQVAMIDVKGDTAVHTGARCIGHAGHAVGPTPDGVHFSVQANLMRRPGTPEAMAKAFNEAQGMPLAERMIEAMKAAEMNGGDARGRQSASILIVRDKPSGGPVWADRLIDLRIEDHPNPVYELSRLVLLRRAYDVMNQGDLALEKGDTEGALKAYSKAREMAPAVGEFTFWTAVALVNAGRVEEAIPLFEKSVTDPHANWRHVIVQLIDVQLMKGDEAFKQRLIELWYSPEQKLRIKLQKEAEEKLRREQEGSAPPAPQ